MLRLRLTCVFLIQTVLLALHAQQVVPPSHFDHVRTKGYYVYSCCADRDGIVWLGTSKGLITYAELMGSYPFSYVRHLELEDIITRIWQDGLGRLWLRTQAKKYMVYEPRTNALTTDLTAFFREAGIPVEPEFMVTLDAQGRVWIWKGRRLWRRDLRKKETRRYELPASAGSILQVETTAREAVISTSEEVYMLGYGDQHPKHYATYPEPMQAETPCLSMAGRGNLWVGAYDRLFYYDALKGTWQKRPEEVYDIKSLAAVDSLTVLGTTNCGLFVYGADGELLRHFTQSATDNGLMNNHIEMLFYSPAHHRLSVSYHKHDLSVLNTDRLAFRERQVVAADGHARREDVIAVGEGDNGTIWLGTEDNGVCQVAGDGSGRMLAGLYPGTAVRAVFSDSRHRLWAGVYRKGLFCSDGRTFFSGTSPYYIRELPDGRLFVLLMGDGIHVLDPATGADRRLPTENPWIMDAAYDRGRFYCATPKFLYVIDERTLKVTNVPLSVFSNSDYATGNKTLTVDRRGWVWMVNYKTQSPVDIYDTRTRRTYQCKELSRYRINGICTDEMGQIWVSTTDGLVRVRVENADDRSEEPRFQLYCYSVNGQQSDVFYNDCAMMRLSDGRLLLGTSGGYQLIDPRQLEQTQDRQTQGRCPLILTSLRINDTFISPLQEYEGRTIIGSDLPYVRELRLKYFENNLMLEYQPYSYTPEVAVTYDYRLDGLSDDWLSMDNHTITLSNLPPGNYRLLIREQGADMGKYRDFEVLTIRIAPVFWKSATAYVLYILTALLAVAACLYYRKRRREQELKVNMHIERLMARVQQAETQYRQERDKAIAPSGSMTEDAQMSKDDLLLSDAIRIVEEHLGDAAFSVDDLSAALGMHRTNLYKRLQAVTGKTPAQFIRLLRLKRARQLLVEKRVMVSQVAYQVGFNSPKKFARYFKDEFGLYPSEYQKAAE